MIQRRIMTTECEMNIVRPDDVTEQIPLHVPAPETLPHGIPVAFDPNDQHDLEPDEDDMPSRSVHENPDAQTLSRMQLDERTLFAVRTAVNILSGMRRPEMFTAQPVPPVSEIITLATFLMDPTTGYNFIPVQEFSNVDQDEEDNSVIEVETDAEAVTDNSEDVNK